MRSTPTSAVSHQPLMGATLIASGDVARPRLPTHLSPAEVKVCAQNIERHTDAYHVAICRNDFVLRAACQIYESIVQGRSAMHRMIKFTKRSDGELRQHIAANTVTLQGLLARNREDLQALCSRKAFEAAREQRPSLTTRAFRQELWTRLQRRRLCAARLLAEVPIKPAILQPIVDRYCETAHAMQRELAVNTSAPDATPRATENKRVFEFLMRTGMAPEAATRNVARILRHQASRDAEVNKLVVTNQKLVAKIASKYSASGFDLDDLKQGGMLGLIRAARDYNWRLGLQFSTYATHWIRHGVQRAIDKERPYGYSANLQQLQCEVQRTREKLAHEHQRAPTAQQIVDYLNSHPGLKKTYSLHDVRRAAFYRAPSLDEPVSVEGHKKTPRIELLPSCESKEPACLDHKIDREFQRQAIFAALSRLKLRDREILIHRFGLSGEGAETLEEVGLRFKITRERVRQIEEKLLQKLRKRPTRDGLERVFDVRLD